MSIRNASSSLRFRRSLHEPLESRRLMSVAVYDSPLPAADFALHTETLSAAPTSAAVDPTKSALGGNLNMQSDRIQDHPFTNLVKTTRGFYNLAGRVASNGKTALANTTTDGWPTEAFMFSVADNAEYGVAIDAGVYKMQFKGPAAVTVTVRRDAPAGGATNPTNSPLPTLSKLGFDAATGIHTYDINVPQGARTLALEFRNTSGSVRDIVILQPGYSLSSFPTFSNEYRNLLGNLQPNVLRLMDFTQTNNNPVSNWADRTQPNAATQTKVGVAGDLVPQKGIAWEYAIELANSLDMDVWVNVPAQANDNYIDNLATLLRNTLEPGLNIYLEHSNEVWNTIFTQNKFNTDQAKAEVAANPNSTLQDGGTTNTTTWADRRHARETRDIAERFKNVWLAGGKANPLNSTVRVVLGGQYSNLSRFDNELAWLNKFYGSPSNYLYGIGIAPYINLGGNQNVEGLTKDQVLNSLRSSTTAMRNGSGLSTAKNKANSWGLKLTAYEGGIDTFGPTSIAAKRAAVLDPQIQQIVEEYLDVWYDAGGNQFNWYTLGARSFQSINGTWSITEDIRDYNQPKELGFKAVRDLGRGNSTTPPPPGGATLSIADASANEGNSNLSPFTLVVTRGGNTSGASSVNFATQNGTAGEGDYVARTGTISFAAGETSKPIVIDVKGDTKVEGNETFRVNLSGAVGATISDAQGVATIINDDGTTPPPPPPPGSVRIESGGAANYTDSLGNVWVKDGSYTGGGSNTTAFAVANTSDDLLYYTRRTGNFSYSAPANNGNYNLRLLFADNNTTTNTRKFDVSVEGSQVLNDFDIVANGGGRAAITRTFPVTISDGKIDMTFSNVVGNASLSGFDLIPAPVPVTDPVPAAVETQSQAPVSAAATAAALRINSGGGSFTDSQGNVWSAESGNVGGGSNTSAFSVSGTTDDSLYYTRRTGNFSYSNAVANGSYSLKLLFTDNNTTTNTRKFDVSVEGSQVLNDFDIVANGGGRAAITRTFPVTISDGKLDLQFTNVVGNASLSAFELTAAAGGTPATISINDVTKNEGNSGLTAFSFTATRSGDMSGTVLANFTVSGQTADGNDVQLVSGPFGFGPNETTKQIVVNVNGDTTVEPNETFLVTLSGASGGVIGDGQGVGTITNDDSTTPPPPAGALRINTGGGAFTDSSSNVWAAETGATGGGVNASAFPVAGTTDDSLYYTRRTGNFSYSNAVNNGNYNLKLLFADNGTTAGVRKFDVSAEGQQILNDFDIVANGGGRAAISRTFPVTISDGKLDMAFTNVVGNASLSAFELTPSTGTPPPESNITINDVTLNEGNSGSTAFNFTVTRSGSTSGASSVQFATQNGTASSPGDYGSASGTVSFAAGETVKTVTVNVVGDTGVESNETFLVVLSGAVGATIVDAQGTGTITNDDSTTPPPPPPGGTQLGGNLQHQDEYSRDRAFADLVKSSSGFDNLSGGNATLDSNGWPTQDFTVPLWANETMDVGRYTITFNGPSNTVVDLNGGKGTIQKVSSSGGVNNWVVDIPTSTVALSLKFTGTSGQVKNLKVIQPGNSPDQVWATKYVNHLKNLRPDTLRMMDITNANHNTNTTWSQAPKVTDATYNKAGGVPWEHLIDLANTVGSHIWVTIPTGANDDYVRQLAAMLKTRLSSTLRAYVEVGNEVWSNLAPTGQINTNAAKSEVASNPNSNLKWDGTTNTEKWSERRYARRMMEVSNLFKSVWTTTFNGTPAQADPINNRVRVILGGQATRLERVDNMLDYINRFYGAPKNFFYGTGYAWYFGLNKYKDDASPPPPTNLTKEQVLEGMNLSVSAYENEQRFKAPATQATTWGLKLHAYELGVDTFGSKNIQAKQDATNDPRMKDLVIRFYNAFKAQGGEAAEWFRLGAMNYNTPSGTWGITNDLDNLNSPKQQAFRTLRGFPATI